MSSDSILDKVKKLRELTGVGFKDCKNAIDENNGDIEKSIEYLRIKGIAKANKKRERVAAEGLVCIYEKENKFTIVEVECLGACANAPIVQVNDDYFEDLDGESIVKILDALKRGEKPPCGPQIDRKNSAPVGGPQTLGDMKFGGK